MSIILTEGFDMEYKAPTPEEKTRQLRQNALYSAQAILQGHNPSAAELVDAAKRIVSFVETGE